MIADAQDPLIDGGGTGVIAGTGQGDESEALLGEGTGTADDVGEADVGGGTIIEHERGVIGYRAGAHVAGSATIANLQSARVDGGGTGVGVGAGEHHRSRAEFIDAARQAAGGPLGTENHADDQIRIAVGGYVGHVEVLHPCQMDASGTVHRGNSRPAYCHRRRARSGIRKQRIITVQRPVAGPGSPVHQRYIAEAGLKVAIHQQCAAIDREHPTGGHRRPVTGYKHIGVADFERGTGAHIEAR